MRVNGTSGRGGMSTLFFTAVFSQTMIRFSLLLYIPSFHHAPIGQADPVCCDWSPV